jgi:hypothetical protein
MARLTNCIFCEEKTKLTGEHVYWPDWSKKYVRPAPKGSHYREIFSTSAKDPNIRGLKNRSRHHGEVNSIKLQTVCERRCNNGWMRERENLTRPILLPIIQGLPAIMDRAAQEKLAAWFVMKSMVAEFSQPDDVATPQKSRTRFMQTGIIQNRWLIFAGHTQSPRWRMAYTRNSVKLGRSVNGSPITPHAGSLEKNTYAVTVGFGELIIWAFCTTVPGLQYEPPVHIRRYMHQIWPYQRGFLWPPGPIVGDSFASILAELLHTSTKSIPWTDDAGAGKPQEAPDEPQPET